MIGQNTTSSKTVICSCLGRDFCTRQATQTQEYFVYFKFVLCSIGTKDQLSSEKHRQELVKNKKPHTERSDVRSIESSSFVAAGFGTTLSQVAGFHRAVPSTTLDKACMQFDHILSYFLQKSTPFVYFIEKFVYNSSMDFYGREWYNTPTDSRR
jgi:hypothetical protein